MCRCYQNAAHVKCPIFLSFFNQTGSFSTYFRKSPQYQISRELVQWEPAYYVRTDMIKLTVAFRLLR